MNASVTIAVMGAYRRPIMIAAVVGGLLLLLYVVVSSPDGDGDGGSPAAAVPGGADPESVAVIEAWSKALDAGDNEGAASLFALPSITQNGTAAAIRTTDDAERFNASLPCGAVLTEAVPHEGFTIATFKLTERPGLGRCGSGVGHEARTAFRIEDGKITEWRRVFSTGDTGPPAPSSST